VRRVVGLPRRLRSLGDAIDAFLAQPDLAASSRRSYAQTLGRLRDALGPELPLESLTADDVAAVAHATWGPGVAARTWNRHVATVRSFARRCQSEGWLARPVDVSCPTGPGRSPTPSSTSSGGVTTSPSGRRRCGGCCTRRRHEPARCSPSTSRTSTWPTSAPLWSRRGAPSSCSTSRPAAAVPLRGYHESASPCPHRGRTRRHPWVPILTRYLS
jgi:hypothetical protein